MGVGTSEGDLSNSVCFGKQFLRRGRIYISACPTKEEKDYPLRGKYHRYRYNDFGDDRKQVEHLSGEVKVKQTNTRTQTHRQIDKQTSKQTDRQTDEKRADRHTKSNQKVEGATSPRINLMNILFNNTE